VERVARSRGFFSTLLGSLRCPARRSRWSTCCPPA